MSAILKHVSIGGAASNAMFKVNRALLVHFVEANKMMYFRAHFSIGRPHAMQFLEWLMLLNAVFAIKITNVMRSEASTWSKCLELSMFESFSDLNLQKLCAEKVRQVPRVSLGVPM